MKYKNGLGECLMRVISPLIAINLTIKVFE